MRYATLGNTGLIVSRLGFGASTFTAGNKTLPTLYKAGPEVADALVGRAVDAGVTYFDTADVYADGESETLLGAALKPHRDRVVISTKVGNRGTADKGFMHTGLSRRHILWSIDRSLARLGTDWVDMYICHREDAFTPLEETLAALDAVVRAGKARYIGYSNWSAWTVAAAMEIQRANGWAQFNHGQMYHSLLGRDVERDTIPMMRRYGLGMTVWGPLAFGFLSGAYSREDLSNPENRFSDMDWLRFDKDQAFALLDVLREIAGTRGITVAQLSLAWLLNRDGVTAVLMGATKLPQLNDNLGAADIVLSAEEMARLDGATAIRPVYPSSDWVQPDRRVARALGRL